MYDGSCLKEINNNNNKGDLIEENMLILNQMSSAMVMSAFNDKLVFVLEEIFRLDHNSIHALNSIKPCEWSLSSNKAVSRGRM